MWPLRLSDLPPVPSCGHWSLAQNSISRGQVWRMGIRWPQGYSAWYSTRPCICVGDPCPTTLLSTFSAPWSLIFWELTPVTLSSPVTEHLWHHISKPPSVWALLRALQLIQSALLVPDTLLHHQAWMLFISNNPTYSCPGLVFLCPAPSLCAPAILNSLTP